MKSIYGTPTVCKALCWGFGVRGDWEAQRWVNCGPCFHMANQERNTNNHNTAVVWLMWCEGFGPSAMGNRRRSNELKWGNPGCFLEEIALKLAFKFGQWLWGKWVLVFELYFRLSLSFQNHLRQLKIRSNTYNKTNVIGLNAECYSLEAEVHIS